MALLIVVVTALAIVLALGMVVLLIGHVVRVCVAKTHASDMTTVVPQLAGMIASMVPFLAMAFRALRFGRRGPVASAADLGAGAQAEAAPVEGDVR
ncbi:hypothetical protein ABZW10_36570 [Kitasatospora sp. NPDC004723]|uniref:hypothetical protein n=1 Tax=Kitasatospora sp. NPDC004723 TaxID=3154288 RepID=UPI00339FDEA3